MLCWRGLQALPWSIEQTQSFFQRKQAPSGLGLALITTRIHHAGHQKSTKDHQSRYHSTVF